MHEIWNWKKKLTYLIKDPLLLFRLLRTFDGSFLWSWLFPSITFLFQIDVFFQTDDTKLRQRQPQVSIVYVGGSIQCHMACIYISIILLSPKNQTSQIKLMQIANILRALNDAHYMHNFVSCGKKFAHAHVRAHTHVCDVRAKSIFERACDVRACGGFIGCAMCDRTFAHFQNFQGV